MTIEAIHSPATDPLVGRVLGERYRLERVIGRGGMSSVYAASDMSLGRTVALKVYSENPASRGSFRRHTEEIGALAGLNHPGLVTLYDAFDSDDHGGVIVLEFVDGPDLRRRLQLGPLHPDAIRLLGRTLADALAYVHRHGIVHRDVTPANILLPNNAHDSLPVAKLTDFGIARIIDSTRHTSEGSVLGTANYLSPEQAVGGAVGAPTDIYALGLVLLEAHTGQRAFPGTSIEALAARLHREPEIPCEIPTAWREVIAECVAREPENRPTGDELVQRLRHLHRPRLNRPVSPSTDIPTELMEPLPPSADAIETGPVVIETSDRTSAGPAVETSPARRIRRRHHSDRYHGAPKTGIWALCASVAAGLLIATLTVSLPGLVNGAPVTETETVEPDYPAVDGILGDHLELLQRLVAR
jgi:eukaryotic-like serine/threonine-protein kinase